MSRATTTTLPATSTHPAVISPPSLLSERQRYLQSLTPAERAARLRQVVQSFETARAAFEDSPHLVAHRHLATTCETIAEDLLETACAYLGDEVFQALLDAAFVVEEGLFDHEDERYLM